MTDEHAEFLPFHAINEFMNSDYRQKVIRTTLNALPKLPVDHRNRINGMVSRLVNVPGFRNSAKAPTAVKTKPLADAFEKNPELVAAILSAWADAHQELRQQVHDLLTGRGWELLPPEADRTQLPGFIPTWPADEDFEVLNEAYRQAYPEADVDTDDVSLMVVWLSGRLPFHQESGEEEEVLGED